MRSGQRKILFLALVIFPLISTLGQKNISDQEIPGTIFLDGETYLQFEDILYIHGFIAPTSRLNPYKAFKIEYNNTIRVISIFSLKFIRIDKYSLGKGQDGENIIKDVVLRVETKSRLVFEVPYFELSWVLVKVRNKQTGELEERHIPFNRNGKLNIQKIIFD